MTGVQSRPPPVSSDPASGERWLRDLVREIGQESVGGEANTSQTVAEHRLSLEAARQRRRSLVNAMARLLCDILRALRMLLWAFATAATVFLWRLALEAPAHFGPGAMASLGASLGGLLIAVVSRKSLAQLVMRVVRSVRRNRKDGS
jgi:hypothetical protein